MSVHFDLQEVSAFLTDPEPGDSTVQHNKTFEEYNKIFGDVVHDINKFIGLLQHVGATFLEKIPWDDLYKELVMPLAGDYSKIKQNANACTTLGTGMKAWGGNVNRIELGAAKFWEGEAGNAFGVHLAAYTLIMDGIGEAMRLGNIIFEGIGDLSEKLGVVVEDAIVKAAKLIAKVAKKVVEKVSGWFGWASLVYDIATDGFKYFEDLYNDVMDCIHLIQNCFALKEHVEEWAQAEQERLQAFSKLPEIVAKLPSVTAHDVITSTVDPQLRTDLHNLEVAISGQKADDALTKIKGDLTGITGITGDENPDIDPPSTDDPSTTTDDGPPPSPTTNTRTGGVQPS